jgi:26S proteasome non-ATPase regulatory subunit 9
MKDPQQQQQQQQQQHPQAAGVQQAQGAGVAANGTGGAGGAPRPVLPFALIDEVSLGSPAASAGLAVGDQLCSFGPVGDTSAAGSAQPTLQDVAQVRLSKAQQLACLH